MQHQGLFVLQTNKAWVLGSEKFKKRVEKLSGKRAKPKPSGKPKKYKEIEEANRA
jgi:hypothetical protein